MQAQRRIQRDWLLPRPGHIVARSAATFWLVGDFAHAVGPQSSYSSLLVRTHAERSPLASSQLRTALQLSSKSCRTDLQFRHTGFGL